MDFLFQNFDPKNPFDLLVKLKTPEGKKAQFRTYDWDQVRKSAVFLEPIKLPKKKVLLLAEQQGIKVD